MDHGDRLAREFEEQRPRLRSVAYRMLGSLSEAEDAVQEAWLRLSGVDRDEIDNLSAWLTTVVARVCLNMLRARSTRKEQPLGPHVPDPIVDRADATDPEHEALLADAVGLALLIVLEALPPAERLAFVLHDMFAVPFDQLAHIMERSPAAVRQLASRGRRRVRQADRLPDTDLSRQWEVVQAFQAAAREGDFDALVAVLDPQVVLRTDSGALGLSREIRGAHAVAQGASAWTRATALDVQRVLVNGQPGVITHRDGRVFSVGAFTVRGGRIVEFDILADPKRLAQLDLQYLPA